MSTTNDFRAASGLNHWPATITDLAPDDNHVPNGPGLFAVNGQDGHQVITNIRRLAGFDRTPGSRVIAFATWLLVLLGGGLMYVSFDAQYQFIFAQKGARAASAIEAAMLDAGMIILSALGIGLALAGKPSKSVRFLIMICAAASAGANFAAANPGSWRSVVAYVSAPVFLAVITDRVISVIRQHVLPADAESAWVPLGRAVAAVLRLAAVVFLYLLRTVLAPSQTLRGLRQMVLDAAPVPGVIEVAPVPELTGPDEPEPRQPEPEQGPDEDQADEETPEATFPTKKAAFLSRYRGHPGYGVRESAGQVAAEIAPLAGLQAGTGRTYIAGELRRLASLASAFPHPAADAKEITS
jgi:hypothetical protein